MDYTQARVNMVKSQVVPNLVHDTALLAGMMRIPREEFADGPHREFAYADRPLQWMASGRSSLTPLQAAWMIQAMEVKAGHRVLVVGAGSGYEAALLSSMGAEVFALESDADLAALGQTKTDSAQVHWRVASLTDGWSEEALYDAILMCGAVAVVPAKLLSQLNGQGRLVAIVGQSGDVVMQAMRVQGSQRLGDVLFETVAPVLPGFAAQTRFVL